MRAALTVFVVLLVLLVGHLLVVVRDALFERGLSTKTSVHVALGEDMLSPRHLLIGMVAFVGAYLVGLTINGREGMTYAALLVLAVLVAWGGWVVARVALRRKVLGDRAVPWWSVLPTSLVLAGLFAWSGIA
ncbi:hypothetical protein [Luteipulveratus mongoliensis]|uniref:Uncharacterized protein n=1 Tax=Luteipulveratus mongoliensis TaxID=571913 RepID=A0A0K1JLS5_9MICO|nr:hypothetical protein [Luteipulveratus mongoliensis]AKU17674.1 hypothetical protein VV02_20530 [Luteipulveratus mongoliensis]